MPTENVTEKIQENDRGRRRTGKYNRIKTNKLKKNFKNPTKWALLVAYHNLYVQQ